MRISDWSSDVCSSDLAQIGLVEDAQVRKAVLQHGDALNPHAEGEALVLVGIDAAVGQHLGMHHAAAEDLQPVLARADLQFPALAAAADVDFGARLGEGEVAGPEAQRQVLASEEGAAEGDRKSDMTGKRVSDRVKQGGR